MKSLQEIKDIVAAKKYGKLWNETIGSQRLLMYDEVAEQYAESSTAMWKETLDKACESLELILKKANKK